MTAVSASPSPAVIPAPAPAAAAAACYGLADAAADYATVRDALELMGERWRDQPSVEAIAARLGLSPRHLARLFERWAGIGPKTFLQALTLDAAQRLLADSASVLETSFEVGFSGPSRLHDLFVSHHAVPPGIYRARGRGLTIAYGFHPSPFGEALLMATPHGLAGLAFVEGGAAGGSRATALADMMGRWPEADYVEDAAATGPYAERVFDPARWSPERPLRVVLIGTDFQIRVWQTLLAIPFGRAATYGDVAGRIGAPKAARAVGAAVGANPVSFVVPCHRVIGQNGTLTGYHWGLARKRAILGWEAARLASAGPDAAARTAAGQTVLSTE
jgi:AraC family transcriptional regulator of adaptative response/methylated-DNA-[protein]-cysteine methyltransferase